MEALHAKNSEATNTRYSNKSNRSGANRRPRRLHTPSSDKRPLSLPGTAATVPIVSAAAATSPAGFLQTLFDNQESVRYVALNQTDIEKAEHIQGPADNDSANWESGSEISASGFGDNPGSGSSSSVEDLFVSRPKRKQRRKMRRNGSYSMRETFDNSRQVSEFTYI